MMLSRRDLLLAGAATLAAGVPAARAEDLEPKACAKEAPNRVTCMALSPDSQTLVSGHYWGGKQLFVWDASNLKLLRSWRAHARGASSVPFHPSGKFFASGGDDGRLFFWDPRSGEKLAEFLTDRQVILSVAFSPDGKLVAVAALDRLVRVWNVATKEVAYEFEGPSQITHLVAFSPTNCLLASGGQGPVRIWNLGTKKIIHECHQHKNDLRTARFSGDGKFVVTSCIKEIRRAKVGAPEEVKVETFDPVALSIAWTPDETLRATYHHIGVVEFRREGREPKQVSVVDGRSCLSLCLDKTGKRLYTGIGGERILGKIPDPRERNPPLCLWDVETLLGA